MRLSPSVHRVNRGVATVTAVSVAAVLLTGATAHADTGTVLAVGRNVNGVCVLDTPLHIPDATLVTATESCEFVGTPYQHASADVIGPAATVKPKVRDVRYDVNPAGGGVRIEDNLTKGHTESVLVEARAVWVFYDERGHVIYDDLMVVRYRRSMYDGSVGNAVATEGYCATGAAVFPHRPAVGQCTYRIPLNGPGAVTFVSQGEYTDHIQGLIPYDERWTWISVRASAGSGYDKWGDFDYDCAPLKEMPTGWSTPDCYAVETPLS